MSLTDLHSWVNGFVQFSIENGNPFPLQFGPPNGWTLTHINCFPTAFGSLHTVMLELPLRGRKICSISIRTFSPCALVHESKKKEHPLLRLARGISQPILCSRIPQRTHVCGRVDGIRWRIATTSSAINAICSISRSSHRSVFLNRVSIVFILTRERKKAPNVGS